METVFNIYTKNMPDMDSRTFVKILKDSKLLNKKITAVDADITFAKVKTQGSKRIKYDQFVEAIKYITEKNKLDYDQFVEKLCNEASNGPILYGTKAEATRFHDDKSTYTGVHKLGGPTTIDKNKTQFSSISEITDRSECNIRGVNLSVEKNV
ncbi:p25-alpha family protein, putative [Plasmodium berghei]|uniref:p25-alpha family protein, putative n=2 Tax=Plasmodium berghei TaxID=5821 RepID=A0A509B1E3_PLABA|nr:p25-alpha family protein, putative [Plasmodium berghei ANKA]CXJ25977.1 p25-alpha family protein, putative [Plasmodium berghei]SCM26899.1 p25-alpha family protein, putative [Plasmodium berghei]SCN28692.1 p25-alpha family protein, putative [Plasmodium berghei]SCO62928.1 p25-alpha family protein, putative [Plasmodium berghei]SCO64440.1 p25-alpha family protein, putative [Plasmodium berghei]|eukprot:XP_034424337.1 p25-alpha family protein, putative [Plasmodium berghei ANKA]